VFDSIDVNKLLEQDKDFRRYVADAALELILADKKNRAALISVIYGFYSIGLDMKTIRKWAQTMQGFTDTPDENRV
jgi:hypothetical protein